MSKPSPNGLTPYALALATVRYLDEALQRGYPHLRDKNGQIIRTLDEAVRAIENQELAIGETRK